MDYSAVLTVHRVRPLKLPITSDTVHCIYLANRLKVFAAIRARVSPEILSLLGRREVCRVV